MIMLPRPSTYLLSCRDRQSISFDSESSVAGYNLNRRAARVYELRRFHTYLRTYPMR